MNIQQTLSKVYNQVKSFQIKDEDVLPGNFTRAIYMQGMLDSAKIFMKIYNGELTEQQIDLEMSKYKNYEGKVDTLSKEIDQTKDKLAAERKKHGKKIDSITKYNVNQLDSFFTSRYR